MPVIPIKKTLQAVYLDYINNYLTREKFAEDYGLTLPQANRLIDVAKSVHESMVSQVKSLDRVKK